MNWLQQTLADVTGTQEPVYGPSAIQPVSSQGEWPSFSETSKADLQWRVMNSTNVETQTIYILTDDGVHVMLQVVYSNVSGLRTAAQLNLKILHHAGPSQHLWLSDPLQNYSFDDEQYCFYADNLAVELSETGDCLTIRSAVNDEGLIDIKVSTVSPGVKVGKDGTSNFGQDPSQPWGCVRHVFWPRCKVEGTMVTKAKTYDVRGRAMFVHALQGMKPHHAAARWNFLNFQSPAYSAVMMEFITPASYGRTSVNVSMVVKDGEVISAGTSSSIEHSASHEDPDNQWPEPEAITCKWNNQTKDGSPVVGLLSGDLGEKADRIDVLAHVPGFVKSILGGVVGTKPFIYQYYPTEPWTLKLTVGEDGEIEEPGQLLFEASFVS